MGQHYRKIQRQRYQRMRKAKSSFSLSLCLLLHQNPLRSNGFYFTCLFVELHDTFLRCYHHLKGKRVISLYCMKSLYCMNLEKRVSSSDIVWISLVLPPKMQLESVLLYWAGRDALIITFAINVHAFPGNQSTNGLPIFAYAY